MLIGAVRKHLAGSIGLISIGPCNESLAATSRPSPKQAAHTEQWLCWSCFCFHGGDSNPCTAAGGAALDLTRASG